LTRATRPDFARESKAALAEAAGLAEPAVPAELAGPADVGPEELESPAVAEIGVAGIG